MCLKRISYILLLVTACCCLPAYAWKMESQIITLPVTTGVTTLPAVNFQQSFDTTPVVFILATSQGGQPSAIRIQNVTTSGFQVAQFEPPNLDGAHATMSTVHYVAIEPGVHTLPNGTVFEVGMVSTTNVQRGPGVGGPQGWATVNFATAFAATPALIAQIQTLNNSPGAEPRNPLSPWLTAIVRNTDNNSTELALERSQVDSGSVNSNETIGYMAVTAGSGSFQDNSLATINYDAFNAMNAVDGWDNGCDNIGFPSVNSGNRTVVATKSTRNDNDGGWLRRCALTDNAIGLTVDEDQFFDGERNHNNESAALVVYSRSFIYDSSFVPPTSQSQWRYEAGSANLSPGQFVTVNFQQTYTSPPAVFVLGDSNNLDPSSVRIRNVTSTGFEAVAVESPGPRLNADAATTMHYFASDKGNFVLPDGKTMVVGEIPVTAIQHSISGGGPESYQTVNFGSVFTNIPAVLVQIQGMANEPAHVPGSASAPWLTVAIESNSVTTSTFRMALDRSEVNDGSVSVAENVAYMGVETGVITGVVDNTGNAVLLEGLRTADNITGWGTCATNNFAQTYPAPPLVIGQKNRHDGGDGGWLRRCSVSTSNVGLLVDEDQDRNNERAHTTEAAGLIVVERSFALGCRTYRDEFSTVSYSNNDGSANWAGDWVEQDSGGGGSAGGQVQITGGILRLQGNNQFPYANVNKITREADLSGYGSAILTFDFDSSDTAIDADDEAWVQISNDGGTTFTTLEAFIGRDSGSRVYDISAYITSNTQIRFAIAQDDGAGACCYGASNEWFEIDNVEIEVCDASTVTVDHYSISATGSGLTCESLAITITAHDSSHAVIAPASGTVIDLSTSTNLGLWAGSSINDGTNSHTFDGTANSVTLDLLHAVAGTVNIDINSGSSPNEDSGEDLDIVFFDTGFRIIDAADNPIDTQVSAKPSATHFLEAVRTDNVTQQCVAMFQNQTVDVQFAAECENPATCAGHTIDLTYNGSSLTVPTTNEDGTASASSFSAFQSVNFAADGKAPIVLRYDDAGRVNLHAQAEIIDSSGNSTGEFIAGFNNFVVKPAGLCVEAQDMDGIGPRSPDCASGDASCSIYIEAGNPFDLVVSGKAWESDTDSDFCDNNTTPNFELVNIALSSNLVAPSGGSNGSLSVSPVTIAAADNGEVTVSETFSEVGVFTFTATPTVNYFDENIAASISANVGRFIPHHFVVIPVASTFGLSAGCGTALDTFHYLGRPFYACYDLQAQALGGSITQNYEGTFNKLANDPTYGAVDIAASISFSGSRLSVLGSSLNWVAGVAAVSANLSIDKSASIDGPFGSTQVGVIASDDDGVTVQPLNLDTDIPTDGDDHVLLGALGSELRYGRVFIPPVYGPDIPAGTATPIPFVIEYWNGSAFVVNGDDSSSNYDGWTEKNCTDGTVSCSNPNVGFVAATTPAVVINGVSDITNPLIITRPGSPGDLIEQIDVDSWLEFDWSGTGDEDPSTQINFGSYRGHDRIIYWREALQ